MSEINYVFENGMKLTATLDQILETAEKLGFVVDFTKLPAGSIPRGYYPSESKGMVKIKDMNEYHIRRALLKRAKEFYSGEFFDRTKTLTNSEFLASFTSMAEDAIIEDLFTELESR